MKTLSMIYKISKTELQTLFYSPIAWLIIVIFTFQTSMSFSGVMGDLVKSQEIGYGLQSVTKNIFGGWMGLFFHCITISLLVYSFVDHGSDEP